MRRYLDKYVLLRFLKGRIANLDYLDISLVLETLFLLGLCISLTCPLDSSASQTNEVLTFMCQIA
jgi:hypothetical protein